MPFALAEIDLITLYGIKNCDTVKKARRWLDDHSIEHQFHDFREQGIDATELDRWLADLGWETLVNRRSTSWKQLDPALRERMDQAAAKLAILEHPTLIKRPLLDTGHEYHVGFSEQKFRDIFSKHTL